MALECRSTTSKTVTAKITRTAATRSAVRAFEFNVANGPFSSLVCGQCWWFTADLGVSQSTIDNVSLVLERIGSRGRAQYVRPDRDAELSRVAAHEFAEEGGGLLAGAAGVPRWRLGESLVAWPMPRRMQLIHNQCVGNGVGRPRPPSNGPSARHIRCACRQSEGEPLWLLGRIPGCASATTTDYRSVGDCSSRVYSASIACRRHPPPTRKAFALETHIS